MPHYPVFGAVSLFAFVIFVFNGLAAGAPGPILPTLRAMFGLSGSQASVLFTVWSAVSLVGVLAFTAVERFVPRRPRLVAYALVMAAGSLLVALSTGWTMVLAGIGFLAFGFGFAAVELAQLLNREFGDKGVAVYNVSCAGFGIGAIAVPFIASLAPDDFTFAFKVMVALAILMAIAALVLPLLPARPSEGAGDRTGMRAVPVIIGFSIVLGLYVAIEAGIAGWLATHLKSGFDYVEADAARATSLFWIGLTVGRFVIGPFTTLVPPGRLVLVAFVLTMACVATTFEPHLALYGYAAAGLFMAPIFPTTVAWLARVDPSARAASAVLALSMIGPAAGAPVIGASFDMIGGQGIPIALLLLGVLAVGAVVIMLATTRRRA